MCGNYRHKTHNCSAHYIRTVVLEEPVLESLMQVTAFATEQEDEFRSYVLEKGLAEQIAAAKRKERELGNANCRITVPDTIIRRLYEDNAASKITDERFIVLSTGCEEEQRTLKQQADTLAREFEETGAKSVNLDKFIEVARKHVNLTSRTPAILREFITAIYVSESDYFEQPVQRISTLYSFIGKISDGVGKERWQRAVKPSAIHYS